MKLWLTWENLVAQAPGQALTLIKLVLEIHQSLPNHHSISVEVIMMRSNTQLLCDSYVFGVTEFIIKAYRPKLQIVSKKEKKSVETKMSICHEL